MQRQLARCGGAGVRQRPAPSKQPCSARPAGPRRAVRARKPSRRSGGGAGGVSRARCVGVRAGPVEIDEEDLLQFPDRPNWYEAKFIAEDMPLWNKATWVASQDLAPNLRNVVVEVEASREKVPLSAAYKAAGQRCQLRVNGGAAVELPVASAPHDSDLNRVPLVVARGDIVADSTKTVVEPTSVRAQVHLLVSREASPEVYALGPDDAVECGPFVGAGIDLKGSGLLALWRFPTLVLMVEGAGIATARALLESNSGVADLALSFRKCVRVYYKAPNEASMAYADLWPQWEARGARVLTTTRSFSDAFDGDDTFAYDPDYTGAIILTGGDAEAEAAARELCAEAEIATVLADSAEQEPPVYLSSTPTSFARWQTSSAYSTAGFDSADADANGTGNGGVAASNGNGNVRNGNGSNGNGNGSGYQASR